MLLYNGARHSPRGGDTMIVLLVSVSIEVRRQVEALLGCEDRIVVGETCQDGESQIRRQKPSIVIMNARAWDKNGNRDSRSLVEFLRGNSEVTIIAISSFSFDRVCFEALGCRFCRPEHVGDVLQPLLQS
jgi:hypothetical protein